MAPGTTFDLDLHARLGSVPLLVPWLAATYIQDAHSRHLHPLALKDASGNTIALNRVRCKVRGPSRGYCLHVSERCHHLVQSTILSSQQSSSGDAVLKVSEMDGPWLKRLVYYTNAAKPDGQVVHEDYLFEHRHGHVKISISRIVLPPYIDTVFDKQMARC